MVKCFIQDNRNRWAKQILLESKFVDEYLEIKTYTTKIYNFSCIAVSNIDTVNDFI